MHDEHSLSEKHYHENPDVRIDTTDISSTHDNDAGTERLSDSEPGNARAAVSYPSEAKISPKSRSIPRSPRVRALATILNMSRCDGDGDSIKEVPMDEEENSYRDIQTNESNLTNFSSQTLVDNKYSSQPAGGLSRTNTNSLFSVLSAPSKISRSAAQQYLFTSSSAYHGSLPSQHEIVKNPDFNTKIKTRPSQRGVCNILTIIVVVSAIVFLFAGYPLSLYITKQIPSSA
ncbi:hypothetical protein DFQ30_007515 [Apophysomyces sp. BC1015]|nr:hypothetical protein DFQ30_007515 [Apophysomyces sp. BC1015]KAG0182057.1 hypothetical protein DFQ29_006038 [Apophysomyces sp. BC1021]